MRKECEHCGEKLVGNYWVVSEIEKDYFATSPYATRKEAEEMANGLFELNKTFVAVLTNKQMKALQEYKRINKTLIKEIQETVK